MVRRPRLRRAAALAAMTAAAGALAAPAAATPPGTNGMLVWQRETPRTPPDLWIADADGTNARAVFATRNFEFDGAWSPVNPELLAFTRGGRAPFSERIYVGNVTTGTVRRLTRGRAAALAPTWSPDGRRIVYFEIAPPRNDREPVASVALFVMNADGTGRRRLTRGATEATDPDFSPDGRRIVFTENRSRGDVVESRLVVMDANGRNRRPLMRFAGRNENNAKWMPDGRRIVFESIAPNGRDSFIETIAADGGGRRTLLATPAFETNPVPSPDGTRIVFTSDRDRPGRDRFNNGLEVYTMAVDGTGIVRVTNNRRADRWPDWQRLP